MAWEGNEFAGGHTTLETKVIKRCDAQKMDRCMLLPPDVKEQQLPSSQLLLYIWQRGPSVFQVFMALSVKKVLFGV